jgi:dihydrofolate synthase/folylpolyglutamate synthase
MSAGTSAGLAGALAELYARVPRGMRLTESSLDAMNAACAAAGHPERAFSAVHVAGTNGKGSVCAMIESIARAAGKRTGLYTSPHLVRFAERIRIGGEPIDDAALEAVLRRALALGPELSFFETATLAAFLAFQEASVELAVIEVGIGGRLDATNVLPPPLVAAITRIAFDHMDKLGDTLPAIAREKAAIAKSRVPVVLGAMPSTEVRVAIEEVAAANGATVVPAEGDDAKAFFSRMRDLGLRGAHQWINAVVAYRVARQLGIDEGALEHGLKTVSWPGRLEWVHTPEGLVILDGAHNPDGAMALVRYLASPARPLALVFGALADKSWTTMLDLLAPLTTRRVYVRPQGRAAAEPTELAARHEGQVAESVSDALDRARAAVGRDGIVVVCGSLYLVGEARSYLLGLPRDPIVAL